MKKIYSLFTYSLLAVQLLFTLLIPITSCAANQEADNLEAWAKMYEEMNQASGGEIEKLMKDMEQSGELDALMKELEQSGELDNIIEAMIKSSPQEFMQNLDQEMQQDPSIMPAPNVPPTPEPVVERPTVPAVPVMQIDKTKLKHVQALLNSIVSKIATIKQKAASKRAVERELNPWEYNLTDLSYYLTTLQDETLAKYLQKTEYARFYDNLVKLERTLAVEEPRLHVEDVLEVEFEDPYLILGFSTSNISKAQAEKRYNELALQKNPFAVKDRLKKQGLSGTELDAAFKKAQTEFDQLFDAYKRIEQKETSSAAFLNILQALHTAIYNDMLIDDAKKLLREYDPEALRLKEAQELKEKDARDYRARVASQRPEFLPPIFDWPSFADRKAPRDTDNDSFRDGGDYQPKTWEDFDHNANRMDISKGDKEKDKDKKDAKKIGEGKKDTKTSGDKKDDKKDAKDGKKDDKKDGKVTGADLASLSKNKLQATVANVDQALKVYDAFTSNSMLRNPSNYGSDSEVVFRGQVNNAIAKIDDTAKAITKDLDTLSKLKDDKDKEIKKYNEEIAKAFDASFTNNPALKDRFKSVFGITDTKAAPDQGRVNNDQKRDYFASGLLDKFQDSFAKLAYMAHDAQPSSTKKTLEKATEAITKNKLQLQAIRATPSVVSPQAELALKDINKNLKDVADSIDKNSKKAGIKLVEHRYKQDIKKMLTGALTADIKKVLTDDIISANTTLQTRGNAPLPINVGPANTAHIDGIKKSYEALVARIA